MPLANRTCGKSSYNCYKLELYYIIMRIQGQHVFIKYITENALQETSQNFTFDMEVVNLQTIYRAHNMLNYVHHSLNFTIIEKKNRSLTNYAFPK